MLRLTNVYKTVKSGDRLLEILKPITLHVPRGQIMAIMGPSGSGKSTLLGLIGGLDNPTGGSIQIDGQEITGMTEDQLALLRGRKVGIIFQSFNLIPTLTAAENVALPLELLDGYDGNPEARAQELLTAVGLHDRGHHYPVQLSGGEQQRVAIARAFSSSPALLLADEPTGNLDSATGEAVMKLMLELNRSQGATMVMVTHAPDKAAQCDRIVTLKDGAITGDRMLRREEAER